MDLEAEEEEAECAGCEGVGEEGGPWTAEEDGHGGEDGHKGEVGAQTGELDVGFQTVEFVEGVEGAPDVCDFVFKKAAGEGEDAMDHLGELESECAGCRFGVKSYAALGQEGGWGPVGKVEATVEVVESACY